MQEDRSARGFVGALHGEILERLVDVELRSARPAYADRARMFRSAWMEQMTRRMSDEAEVRVAWPDEEAEFLAKRVVRIFQRLNGPVNRIVVEWDTHEAGRGFSHRLFSQIR